MIRTFILGNPRSGTSLLRLMLNQHTEIVAPPECGFMQWWHFKYKSWKEQDCFNEKLELFLNDLFSSRKIETWDLDRNKLKHYILNNKPKNFGALAECVYLTYDLQPESIGVVVDKNNYYINHIPLIKNIWPDAKFIHLVRDGRDVACSYMDVYHLETHSPYKPKLPVAITQIAQEWINNNRLIAKLLTEKGKNYSLVKYEDLIIDTQKTLKNITDFLGIDFEISMLDYYTSHKFRKQEPLQTLDWKIKTREKPDPTKIERYRTDLTEEQIELFNKIAEDELIYFEYAI